MGVEEFLLRSLGGMRRDRALQTISSKLKNRNLLLKRRSTAGSTARFSDGASNAGVPGQQRLVARRKRQPRPTPVAEYAHLLLQQRMWQSYAAAAFTALSPITYQSGVSLCGDIDRHGASIEVVQSRCPSHIGVCGILLAETGRTVAVMAPDGKTVKVLKQGTTLQMGMPVAVPERVKVKMPTAVLLDGTQLARSDRR